MDLTARVHWLRVQSTPAPEKLASLAQRGLAFFVGGPIEVPAREQAKAIVSPAALIDQ